MSIISLPAKSMSGRRKSVFGRVMMTSSVVVPVTNVLFIAVIVIVLVAYLFAVIRIGRKNWELDDLVVSWEDESSSSSGLVWNWNGTTTFRLGSSSSSSSKSFPEWSERFIRIPVDPSCSIGSSILGIWQDRERSRIIVKTKARRRWCPCPNPLLRGRLSGPALVMIEQWKQWDDTTLVGTYRAPFSGLYFLEIVVLLCRDWTRQESIDFLNLCLENPLHHRLSALDASIPVVVTTQQTRSSDNYPYWIAHINSTTSPHQPLYTRFQPQDCRLKNRINQSYHDLPLRCTFHMDLQRFQHYHLQWNGNAQNNNVLLRDKVQRHLQQQPPNFKLCLIGWSHSRVLFGFLQELLPLSQLAWGQARYPSEVTQPFIFNLTQNLACQKFVLGLGQWPASGLSVPGIIQRPARYNNRGPMLWKEFERETLKMLNRFTPILRSTFPGQQNTSSSSPVLFLRSIHYNPIGDAIGACPPSDWRSIPVIDGYNRILHRLAQKRKFANFVSFLDTQPIMSPLWDSARDWCHYDNEAGKQEALYIVAQVLGILPSPNQPLADVQL